MGPRVFSSAPFFDRLFFIVFAGVSFPSLTDRITTFFSVTFGVTDHDFFAGYAQAGLRFRSSFLAVLLFLSSSLAVL